MRKFENDWGDKTGKIKAMLNIHQSDVIIIIMDY